MKSLFIRLFAAPLLLAAFTSQAQNVATDWNTIAARTIITQGHKLAPSTNIWFAYTSIAVYDAVNSIHRKFRPFYFAGRTNRDASDEAAAVSAAHRVLLNYFPAQQSDLDVDYQSSISNIVASPQAIQAGMAAGEAAADAVISARMGDGLEADVTYTPQPGIGKWQPTLPGFAPAVTPWLAQVRPFTMHSPDQFLPAGPYPLTSDQWVADFNLTRIFGDVNSSVRTANQREIGLFWTDNPALQYSRTWTYLAQNYRLSLMDSARLLAILWTGGADTAIGCFTAKYAYSFWRPVTAIRAGGGNSDLTADPGWTPLGITPPHPEYPAAHGCVTSTLSFLVADFFGTQKVHVVVDSAAFGASLHTHTFESTADWLDEVFWGRIYVGFHFHHSLQDGVELGKRVADQLFENHFQEMRKGRRGDDTPMDR